MNASVSPTVIAVAVRHHESPRYERLGGDDIDRPQGFLLIDKAPERESLQPRRCRDCDLFRLRIRARAGDASAYTSTSNVAPRFGASSGRSSCGVRLSATSRCRHLGITNIP